MKKILCFISLLFFFSISYAGLSVDPYVTDIKASPGSLYKGKYSVRNTYDRDINIIVETKQGKTFSGNGCLDVKNWLEFEQYKYFIKAGNAVEIPYTAIISEKFKGSISARITFAIAQEEGQMITILISVPMYVTVEGTQNIDYCVDSLNLYVRENNVYYKLILENKGNVHIRHSGSIEIYSKNKKKLLKTISIQETVPIYCGERRDFTETLFSKTEFKKGKYVAVFKIRAFGKEIVKELKFKVFKNSDIVELIKNKK